MHRRCSRRVIACNRLPGKPRSVAQQSDGTLVPANANLSRQKIDARQDKILRPYQDRIAKVSDRRAATGQPTAFFAMHSCTDRLRTDPRL